MTTLVIAIVIGILVAASVALATTIVMPSPESTATEDRLSALASRRRGGAGESEQESLLMTSDDADAASMINKLLENIPALGDYLDQANVKMSPSKFAILCLSMFGAGVAVCVVSPVPILLAPIFGMVLAALPMGWVMWKRKKRLAKFGNQMPEALELLGRSLRAGHSLQAGFGLVANEMHEPLSVEFGRAFEEQNFGIPLDEALEDMATRIPNMDLRFFATAVILQRQTGGDLAEILDKIGHLVRERLMILGQIQALTGEGRMSGAVLLALPPVLFLVMLKLNFEYVMMLFTDEIGRYLLCGALVSQVLGALMIKKIITIKV
ncbi:MAG: type II secretion system F family protein [Planctomycetota bacterium]